MVLLHFFNDLKVVLFAPEVGLEIARCDWLKYDATKVSLCVASQGSNNMIVSQMTEVVCLLFPIPPDAIIDTAGVHEFDRNMSLELRRIMLYNRSPISKCDITDPRELFGKFFLRQLHVEAVSPVSPFVGFIG